MIKPQIGLNIFIILDAVYHTTNGWFLRISKSCALDTVGFQKKNE